MEIHKDTAEFPMKQHQQGTPDPGFLYEADVRNPFMALAKTYLGISLRSCIRLAWGALYCPYIELIWLADLLWFLTLKVKLYAPLTYRSSSLWD